MNQFQSCSRYTAFVLLSLLAFSGTTNATPVTLNFDSLDNSSFQNFHGPVLEQNGFRLQTRTEFGGFSSYGPSSGFYTGSTQIFGNVFGGFTTLTQIDGSAFSIDSIALAFRIGREGDTQQQSFTGVTSSGSVTQTFSTIAGPSISTTNFSFNSAFTNLLSLTWFQGAEGHQFSDIVVDGSAAVPEPTSLALLSIGLVGIALRRRKLGIQ